MNVSENLKRNGLHPNYYNDLLWKSQTRPDLPYTRTGHYGYDNPEDYRRDVKEAETKLRRFAVGDLVRFYFDPDKRVYRVEGVYEASPGEMGCLSLRRRLKSGRWSKRVEDGLAYSVNTNGDLEVVDGGV
jgi:hypothetical protein